MPHLSHCNQQLQALRNTYDNLVIAHYVELVKYTVNELLEERRQKLYWHRGKSVDIHTEKSMYQYNLPKQQLLQ
jgi:hypothetical protein